MKHISIFIIIISMLLFVVSCDNQKTGGENQMMDKMVTQFVETDIKYDESLLDDDQKKVVENLYYASKIMDDLFFSQVYSKNYEVKNQINSENTKKYFDIMFGPFDRLDHNKPFFGSTKKPEGANFYPEDMTKQELVNWIENHPEDESAFSSEFTIIRRENDKLVAIPYSEFYKEGLTKAANFLNKAAEFAENKSLKKYLTTRAAAFLSNDYYESDMAWMDLKDHAIEVVIGPYEVYEDEMFNYKAAFESFVTIMDPEESKKLAVFGSYLNAIEKHLPIDDKHKNFDRGSESPIVVVQEVFSAGDSKAGVQTLAFNLPNDERVREAKGSKKVMLKNVHVAKFEKLLLPIAEVVLDPEQLKYVTFDGFFNHTLMHEMSHGVGPGKIKKNGKATEVRKELKETYSKMEECKADVLGMYNNMFMIDKGVYTKSFANENWVTFLAGTFRSVRFGINEAHGGGNAIIYNYLLEKGAYEYDESTQKVRVNFDKIYDAVKELANILLTIQAEGDYEASLALIKKYAVNSTSMNALRENLNHLPVDIKPVFQIEKMLK
jgi:peptidase M49-like protein